MGRGRSKAGATGAIGSKTLPTEDSIKTGGAEYGGLPVRYNPRLTSDARNMTTVIEVSPKFFEHDENVRRHILNHEVAHNLSDELMEQNSGRWQKFASAFIEEKKVPETSRAYEQGQRTYWEGIYGDIGATALSETVTRAITEYLDNPKRLRERSAEAYKEIQKYMKNRR